MKIFKIYFFPSIIISLLISSYLLLFDPRTYKDVYIISIIFFILYFFLIGFFSGLIMQKKGPLYGLIYSLFPFIIIMLINYDFSSIFYIKAIIFIFASYAGGYIGEKLKL